MAQFLFPYYFLSFFWGIVQFAYKPFCFAVYDILSLSVCATFMQFFKPTFSSKPIFLMHVFSHCRHGLTSGTVGTSEQIVDGANFQEDIEDDDEQPLVRHHSRRVRGRTTTYPVEALQMADSPPLSPQPHNIGNDHQHNGGFPSEVFCFSSCL
jgi:hypothetical protein